MPAMILVGSETLAGAATTLSEERVRVEYLSLDQVIR
jgi:hypothetical protein